MKTMTTKTSKTSSRQGFTLVEVLVSSFLTLIIMGMLFSVLVGTMNAWEGGTSRLKSAGDARLALDILKTDLESLVARQTQYNQEWIFSGPYQIDGNDDFQAGVSLTSPVNTWLTFFAPSLDRAEGQDGDIVALSYRTAYQDPISTANRDEDKIFGLYKAMTTTIEAFNNVLGYDTAALLVGDGGGLNGYWDQGNPTPSPSESSGFLAPNVVKFAITWLVRKPGDTQLTRYNEDHYIRLSNSLIIYDANNTSAPVLEGGKIEAAEVSLTLISDEGMRRFSFLNSTTPITAAQSNAIIKEFGRTHNLRVPISY